MIGRSRRSLRVADARLRELFDDEAGAPDRGHARARYEALAAYFTLGFLRYRLDAGSQARYPGAPSSNGPLCDRMEGFSRMAPLFAAWGAGGGGERMPLPGRTEEARPLDLLEEGMRAGVRPKGPGAWGPIRDHRQQLVEAADLAVALWLARESLWDRLGGEGRDRVAAWLRAGVDRRVIDNNWHLFPVVVWAVLRGLGVRDLPDDAARAHWERFRSFHLGDGWFRDGPKGAVDYYNAWQMHYVLHRLGDIAPDLDRSFREEATGRFLTEYRFLMGPRGFPILGRSVCYRMAAPAPLVGGALAGRGEVAPGLARRALDRTWRHFIGRGAVRDGLVTQGYGRTDLRFLDAYSGPASPLWSLRSLVLALEAPADHPLWTAPEEPLPVERTSFELELSAPGWRVRGSRESGEIEIRRPGGLDPARVPVRAHPRWRRALDRLRGTPSRPGNDAAKSRLARYSALEPFCGYGA